MYTTMFEIVMIISFLVWAINATFWEGMIFEEIGNTIEESVPYWLYKPMIGCVICMAPWWGLMINIFLFDNVSLIEPIAAMGVNAILVKWTKE